MVWRCVAVVAMLLASIWLGYLAAFNWWAAGGPPTPHPDVYATRGNVFFALAFLCLAASILVAVLTVQRRRRLKDRSRGP